MENYFNYFTEIEECFQRRRGSLQILSTLDWALIESWKDAGVPLQAVLRGINASFDSWERRPSKTRKVNGLAYCAQEVLAAAEEMAEAAVGSLRETPGEGGFERDRIVEFLRENARKLEGLQLPPQVEVLARETSSTLNRLADECPSSASQQAEDLERRLTVLEEKLFAALLAATPDEAVVSVRADADRDLAPYRRKMTAPQIEQLHKQYVHKRLLDRHGVPRLSLFYM